MKQPQHNAWFVSPRSFIKLLGAEYDMLVEAGAGVLGKFYLAAVAIVVIIVTSFGSIRYAIDLLFHDLLTEICLSVFFAMLFACIYVFLINTFSKNYLPAKRRLFSLSNIIRCAFIVFIAYLVAQPLAIIAAGSSMDKQTNQYKEQVLAGHLKAINAFYNIDLEKLQQRKQYCLAQKTIFGTPHFDSEIGSIETSIDGINDKVSHMEESAKKTIDGSSFFLYRIQAATHYWSTWILTTFLIVLFLLPGYLIYSIASDDAYYTLKKHKEKSMIMGGYENFCQQYKLLFLERQGINVSMFSRFDDPPFKLVRKTPALPGSIEAFFQKHITRAD